MGGTGKRDERRGKEMKDEVSIGYNSDLETRRI
jgi:hypothetical protein